MAGAAGNAIPASRLRQHGQADATFLNLHRETVGILVDYDVTSRWTSKGSSRSGFV